MRCLFICGVVTVFCLFQQARASTGKSVAGNLEVVAQVAVSGHTHPVSRGSPERHLEQWLDH